MLNNSFLYCRPQVLKWQIALGLLRNINNQGIESQVENGVASQVRYTHGGFAVYSWCRAMSAVTSNITAKTFRGSMTVPPPAHPTYDLKAIIRLALAEDAGDRGPETWRT
eukprot:Gb_04302 [translate_table: standard]